MYSHHIYPNTVNDFEVEVLEPYLNYLPKKKSNFYKYFSIFISPIIYSIGMHLDLILRTIKVIKFKEKP